MKKCAPSGPGLWVGVLSPILSKRSCSISRVFQVNPCRPWNSTVSDPALLTLQHTSGKTRPVQTPCQKGEALRHAVLPQGADLAGKTVHFPYRSGSRKVRVFRSLNSPVSHSCHQTLWFHGLEAQAAQIKGCNATDLPEQ